MGATFAPVVVGAQAPGSLGVTKPSAPVAELTTLAAALALLRTCSEAAALGLTLHTDCEYAVEVPQLKARASSNHELACTTRAEFEARSRAGYAHLAHVRGNGGDPCYELVDVLADLGSSGEVSRNALLSWLGGLRLPERLRVRAWRRWRA